MNAKKVKLIDWEHWAERPYGAFIVSLSFKGVDAKYFSRVGLNGFGYKTSLYQYPDLYMNKKEVKANLVALSSYFKKHNIFDLSDLLEKFHSSNVKEIKKIIASNLSALDKLSAFREMVCGYFPFIWMVYPLEIYYKELTTKIVPKHVKSDAQKWVGDVSVPKKKNTYVLMQEELVKSPIEEVHKKFAWLKSRDGFTDFYTIEELEEIKDNLKESEPHKVMIPKQLMGLVDELKELIFYRTDRTDKFYEILGLARPIFQEVASKIGVSFKELAFYDVDSILVGIPKKVRMPYSYLYLNGKQSIINEKFVDFKRDYKEEVTGTPAYGGIVKGFVKIVKHPSDIKKVIPNDILVTQMTLPSFILAMQKASAFVTDEGGITCHAAIISRELKKPCIIGTKIATKVFKDGDLVEVDANKGIVRKIK